MDIHDMTSVTHCSEFYLRADIKVKYKCCTLLSLHKEATHEKRSRYPRRFSYNSNSKVIRIAAQRECLIIQTVHNPSKTQSKRIFVMIYWKIHALKTWHDISRSCLQNLSENVKTRQRVFHAWNVRELRIKLCLSFCIYRLYIRSRR